MSTRRLTAICTIVLVVCMAASVFLTRRIDHERHGEVLREVLWIPSANTVKKMSLGYNGLVANLYWTRVVQYFGGKHHVQSREYELLEPLLDITTTLDPKLLVAYQFGGIFLAQAPPEGAGDPEAAAELVLKGIRNNPEAWRLWYHLGYIYWQEMHDPDRASKAFLEGSKMPGAYVWMKVMAAALANRAGERETARYLWSHILESTEDEHIKDNARNRLIALRIDEEVEILQQRVDMYREKTGRMPSGFEELVAAGWLRSVPRSPDGKPYEMLNGHVELADHKKFPFITKGLPEGFEASDLPKLPSK